MPRPDPDSGTPAVGRRGPAAAAPAGRAAQSPHAEALPRRRRGQGGCEARPGPIPPLAGRGVRSGAGPRCPAASWSPAEEAGAR